MNYLIFNITNFHHKLKGDEGSSWTINLIIQHQLVISEITPCEGSSYFPLPKERRNSRERVSNVQNKNNEGFKRCLVISLNPVNKNPAKIRNIDNELAKRKTSCS